MCGYYEFKATARDLIKCLPQLNLRREDIPGTREMFPTDSVLVITANSEGFCASHARWGLVGNFLDQEPRTPLTTLRGEGLASRPFYSKLLARKRCLIPATAFFEWQSPAGGGRRKLRISHSRREPLLIAGVFDHHRYAGTTCAMLTTAANGDFRPIHERMPLVLTREEAPFWLADHPDFPVPEFEAILAPSSRCSLKAEVLREPEPSPQLAFAFA